MDGIETAVGPPGPPSATKNVNTTRMAAVMGGFFFVAGILGPVAQQATGQPATPPVACGVGRPESRALFERAMKEVRRHEGGWADDAADKPTKYGVVLETFSRYLKRKASIDELKAMDWATAEDVYWALFWCEPTLDTLAPAIAYATLDFSIHSGAGNALKALASSAGVPRDRVKGYLTAETRAAVAEQDQKLLLARFTHAREEFLAGVIKRQPVKEQYRAGWTRRVADVLAFALALLEPNATKSPNASARLSIALD